MEKTLELLEFNKIINILISKTDTVMGRELIEDLHPVSNLALLKRWQKETTDGCRLLTKTNLDLSGAADLRPLLVRCRRGGVLNPLQLREIANSLIAFKKVKKILLEYGRGIFLNMTGGIKDFPKLEGELLNSINEEGEVLDNASKELSRVRKEIRTARGRIQRELERILKSPSLNRYLQDNIVTQRNNRYVVPVKVEYRAQVKGIVHDQSASGSTLFIEPVTVVEANNNLNRLHNQEQKEIDRILANLSAEVSKNYDDLRETLNTAAEIDFILAKSKLSLEMRADEPLLNEKGYLRIVNGRHPLLKGKVVPICLELGENIHAMVITGPNTGGKTVTLKTVGLLSLMAQAGLHIPVGVGTQLCIFDRVFADIGDEQNLEQSLSTFSGHMKNIINILSRVTAKSLVLLDELGAGTDPTEGAALAMSILEYLHHIKARTIATTHFSSLKSFAYDHEGIENASVEFDKETLQPTYRLLQGVAGSSNAFEIAGRLGLDQAIISRANIFMGEEQLKLKRLMENFEESQRKIYLHQKTIEEDKEKIDMLKQALEKEIIRLEEREREVLQKAREEALQIVNQAKRKMDKMIKEIEKSAREKEPEKRKKLYHNARVTIKDMKENLITQMDDMDIVTGLDQEDLKLGQIVFIKSLKQKGRILNFSETGEVNLQVGVLKISTDISDLAKVSDSSYTEHKIERSSSSRLTFEKSLQIKSELDLRGNTLQEAIEKVDKYLDDAFLVGLNKVYLIHGKGTGVLRKGLHDYLAEHRQVKSFKLSAYNEGGSGVTIINLGG